MSEKKQHWSEDTEYVTSNRPLLFLLWLMKHMPFGFVHLCCFPVSFFYVIFARKARNNARKYQKILREYTNGEVPKRISPWVQIFSFSLCVVEKMEGWLNKFDYKNLIKHDDDDLNVILAQLERGEGAFVIGSHLGNMELLRSISSLSSSGVQRHVEVTVVMEMNGTQKFNNILTTINSNVKMNLIDSKNIGPDTVDFMQDQIKNGGLVFVAADRTSAGSRDRVIRKKFLGKEAEFPYGVFLLAFLLNVPTYYIFGLRDKTVTAKPRNHIFVEKSKIDFNCTRSERQERISDLCDEYIGKIEKYIKLYPYQWYNFFDFWCEE